MAKSATAILSCHEQLRASRFTLSCVAGVNTCQYDGLFVQYAFERDHTGIGLLFLVDLPQGASVRLGRPHPAARHHEPRTPPRRTDSRAESLAGLQHGRRVSSSGARLVIP